MRTTCSKCGAELIDQEDCCHGCLAVEDASRVEALRDYLPPAKRGKIHLISKIDHLKGDWWLWEADLENPDGSITHGTAQADGGGHGQPEAFEADDETAEEGRKP